VLIEQRFVIVNHTRRTMAHMNAIFHGQGPGFASKLQRACSLDDTTFLFEVQVSLIEELDCAPTHIHSSAGGRVDGWCNSRQHFSVLAQNSAVALYATQASSLLLFRRYFRSAATVISFDCCLGHSQGSANAMVASAALDDTAAVFLSR
jgi:malonyl CoA-acyl carrier protein transacylase